MLNIHGKLLTDEQAVRYQVLWDSWMEEIKTAPSREEYAKQHGLKLPTNFLDSHNSPLKDLEKKYKPQLLAILNAAPDAPAELAANG